MNIKKTFCWLFALCLICPEIGHAQLLGPYGTSPITVEVDANGLLSATGTYGGTGSLSLSGAGTRMFWYPQKAAFRAGNVSGTDWNDSNVGTYSAAFGQDTLASGSYSFAAGYDSTASNSYSFAAGWHSLASGSYSFAAGGYSTASGDASVAMGVDSDAQGFGSVAMGSGSIATGSYSFAAGIGSDAEGNYSVALGEGLAGGQYSVATGEYTHASGDISAAFNYETNASSYESTAFGQYNVGGGNATSWVSTDPLFEIGNGTSSTPSDALVVYKSGTVAVHATLRCGQGGDIAMGSFTAGTAP